MNRRQMRTHVFNIIYFCEFHNGDELSTQIDNYLVDEKVSAEHSEEIKNKACKVIEHIKTIDEDINNAAIGWKTSRMSKIDLAILRLAIYEMFFDDDVPESVAINEAVELAKSYSGEEAGSFINGILGKLSKQRKA